MTKLKQPLFSLEAKGTVADALTFQRSHHQNIARLKPIPSDPRTLPQMYQRWLYDDYACLWRQQSEATKQTYRTRGSRYHITGYNLWLREYLKSLPDLLSVWHLDEPSGAVAHDSSRNLNHATIFGASPVSALINGGLSFDGLNDYLLAPWQSAITTTGIITFEFFIKMGKLSAEQQFLAQRFLYSFWIHSHNRLRWVFGTGSGWGSFKESIGSITDIISYHHIVLSHSDSQNKDWLWIDGILDVERANTDNIGANPANPALYIFQAGGNNYWTEAVLDEIRVYDRLLDLETIKIHSERRYP